MKSRIQNGIKKYENDLVKSTTKKSWRKIANWLNEKGLTLLWRKYYTTLVKVQEIVPKYFLLLLMPKKWYFFKFFNHSVNAASVQRTKQGFL